MRLGVKPVNITVDKSVAHALNEALKDHNVVRDAFMNFLLMSLRSSDDFLRYFKLPASYTGSHFDAVLDPTPVSPLKAIAYAMSDPYYYLRTAVEERSGVGLYALEPPEAFHAFSCYLPDESVPGTQAQLEQAELSQLLLDSLKFDEHEKAAFGQPAEVMK